MVFLPILYFVVSSPTNAAEKARLQIDSGNRLGSVPLYFFGNNIKAYQYKDPRGRYGVDGAGLWDARTAQPDSRLIEAARSAGIRSLRWPGGKQAEMFSWKSAVGPARKRKNQKFGLPEFLHICSLLDAEPIITLPYGIDAKQDAADLVEYLNAPEDSGSPGGKTDWAAIRRTDGHARPWTVRWFEYGNETYNTNISGQEYIRSYLQTKAAMTSVDGSIMLGAQLRSSGNPADKWNHDIVSGSNGQIDFGILHIYLPVLPGSARNSVNGNTVALAALSVDARLDEILATTRHILSIHGTTDTPPLIVSEFNGNYGHNDPIPYRFTLFNAIHNVDMLRIMLRPEYGVAMSNYWLFANSHWGMVWTEQDETTAISKQSDQLMYELVNRHIGNEIVDHRIAADRFEFSGGLDIPPRLSRPENPNLHKASTTAAERKGGHRWKLKPSLTRGFRQSLDNGVVTIHFDGKSDPNYRHAYATIAAEPDTHYRVSVKIRAVDIAGGKVGIAVGSARGWQHDYYQSNAIDVSGTTNGWSTVSADYYTGADNRNFRITARRVSGHGNLSGTVYFGDISVQKVGLGLGPVRSVTAITTRDGATGEIHALAINKHMDREVTLTIDILDSSEYSVSSIESLTGTSPFATNIEVDQPDNVRVTKTRLDEALPGRIQVLLPPMSLTGITFEHRP